MYLKFSLHIMSHILYVKLFTDTYIILIILIIKILKWFMFISLLVRSSCFVVLFVFLFLYRAVEWTVNNTEAIGKDHKTEISGAGLKVQMRYLFKHCPQDYWL